MASQVLSGSSNPSYTNNTGQNVRVVINYMASRVAVITTPGFLSPEIGGTLGTTATTYGISINWAGVSAGASSGSSGVNGFPFAIGRNVATITTGGAFGNNAGANTSTLNLVLPTELMLAPGQTFSATCAAYNIVVIPEAG